MPNEFRFCWDAFCDLSSERLYEGGLIPINAIRQYCRDNKIVDRDELDLIQVIRHLDGVYNEHLEKQHKKEQKKSKKR